MTIALFDPARDMSRIIDLYQSCFAEPPWHERFDPSELEANFEEMLCWPDTRFLVFIQDKRAVAATIGFHVSRKPDVLKLLDSIDQSSFYAAELFVDPNKRKRGVCTKLLESLLSLGVEQGFTRVSARTSTAQSIIQHLFLERLGCKVVSRQDVVSTKWLDGKELLVPDQRIIMTGSIPNEIAALATSTRPLLGHCGF